MTTFYKDVSEGYDYHVDWTTELGTDTIATVTWTVPDGLTAGASSNTLTHAVIWLSGGTLHENYVITCVITTAGGRTFEDTFDMTIT